MAELEIRFTSDATSSTDDERWDAEAPGTLAVDSPERVVIGPSTPPSSRLP